MNNDDIFMTFWRIINWAGDRNRTAKSYGTHVKLYITEIHTIAIIGENSGILQRDVSVNQKVYHHEMTPFLKTKW